jgi:hypothetical protein
MIDDFVKIIGAITGLINAIAWPIVAAWLILKFAPRNPRIPRQYVRWHP